MRDTAIDDLDAGEILARAGRNHRVRKSLEAENFRLAAIFADLHNPDSRPTSGAPEMPGMERPRRFGGDGTPFMWEFAVADLAVELEMSTAAAKFLVRDTLNTRHRLPRLWARVEAEEVKVGYARLVSQQTHHLSAEAAKTVDAEVAEYADGRLTWARFEALVTGKVVAADPEAAAAKEAEEAARQFARASRSSEHGMKGFYLRSTTAVIVRFEATVAYLAAALRQLGDTDPEDLRRVKPCLVLANPFQAMELLQAVAAHRAGTGDVPDDAAEKDRGGEAGVLGGLFPASGAGPDPEEVGEQDLHPSQNDADDQPETPACSSCEGVGAGVERFTRPFRPGDVGPADGSRFRWDWSKLLPTVTIYVHLSQDTLIRDVGGVARFEREGPVTVQHVREWLAPHHRFSITPVVDCENMAPVDAYEIPDRHRTAVHLRTPADSFPFSANLSTAVDLDHTEEYVTADEGGEPGQSWLGNYGPLIRFHHRIKTFGGWKVKQPFPGIYLWRDTHGGYYLVDHTGTRRVTRERPGSAAPVREHTGEVEVNVYPGRDTIEHEPAHAS